MSIKNVVVIGSGVMGSGIAAHIANSNTKVTLLDRVITQTKDRNYLANKAIEQLRKSQPAALIHERQLKWITAGNLEDDLHCIKEADWIIEAIIEDKSIKKQLYQTIAPLRKKNAVISSNTSTIPLQQLMEGMKADFKKHFIITHFFNPPRYMRLLEIVHGEKYNKDAVSAIKDFADIQLGKGVVQCHDTPGFIANRIGCFWLTSGVMAAMKYGISVEEADLVIAKPFGIPKTGIFGLLDLIGIDLMPLIAKELKKYLPEDDLFIRIYEQPQLISHMINAGYTGRKGKGGFYRLNQENGKKVKEAKNLQTGVYEPVKKPVLASLASAKQGIRHLLEHPDSSGQYARKVMLETLCYSASLIPEVADDVATIDTAMKLGYNWQYGPFALIDQLGDKDRTGAQWLAQTLEEEQLPVPAVLKEAAKEGFYPEQKHTYYYFSTTGYQPHRIKKDAYTLAEITAHTKPVLKNPSASLWDMGDGITCLQYHSKMNSVDPLILEMIEQTTEKVKESFQGLVIANDAQHFCVGANIGVLLFAANIAAWKQIEAIIKQGQRAYMGLKYAPFPVVSAVSGMALGGGCEILLHSDAVQAHIETYTGLVEMGVGVIPGWGGCKEMLLRHLTQAHTKRLSIAQQGGIFALALQQAVTGQGSASVKHPFKTLGTMPAISKTFENIALAKVATSAEQAKDMLILRADDRVTMNRSRLLADAKQTCLLRSKEYTPPEEPVLYLPGKTAKAALDMVIDGFSKTGKATSHDVIISKHLATVLSGGNTDITQPLTEQALLDLELTAFMELIKTKATLARLEHMIDTGKPLRN